MDYSMSSPVTVIDCFYSTYCEKYALESAAGTSWKDHKLHIWHTVPVKSDIEMKLYQQLANKKLEIEH